uniref:uncharacterized protein n=1 Tax=Pristiophorus japonicus TaxID=55135 RepID=UPI00398F1F23
MGTECEARLRVPPVQLLLHEPASGSTAVPGMGSDWKRACGNLTINYNKHWPASPSQDKQQEHRHPAGEKKGYFSTIDDVWKTPTIRNNYGLNHLYSNPFQQITPDCSLEFELSSMHRNGDKSETDLTKNDVSIPARNKGSYQMLIQQLEELSMMRRGRKFRKLYRPDSDSEEVTKKNSTNHHTKQVSVSKSSHITVSLDFTDFQLAHSNHVTLVLLAFNPRLSEPPAQLNPSEQCFVD